MGTGTIIFLLLLVFVITPIIKIGLALWRARKQFKQFYNTMSGNAHQHGGGYDGQDDYQNYAKKKKYNSNDGEYVSFEDIAPSESESEHREHSESNNKHHQEQQIVDVEWEDI